MTVTYNAGFGNEVVTNYDKHSVVLLIIRQRTADPLISALEAY
jgi:hypothetical protein